MVKQGQAGRDVGRDGWAGKGAVRRAKGKGDGGNAARVRGRGRAGPTGEEDEEGGRRNGAAGIARAGRGWYASAAGSAARHARANRCPTSRPIIGEQSSEGSEGGTGSWSDDAPWMKGGRTRTGGRMRSTAGSVPVPVKTRGLMVCAINRCIPPVPVDWVSTRCAKIRPNPCD